MKSIFTYSFIIFLVLGLYLADPQPANSQNFDNWKTDLSKRSIDLETLVSGGPPKDGIPSLDNPEFVQFDESDKWIADEEPVIAFRHEGISRAYPLQIMIWHEIVNDWFNDTPVLITFCPLCYSAIVFDRRIDGKVHDFGVSGFLRHSDMIMFDRKTESLWQQFTGEAVVGEYTGMDLKVLPSQIISYKQFKDAYPDGKVLSKDTGHDRPYGQNPYTGYDDVDNTPFLMGEIEDDRLKPMEKLIGVRKGDLQKAYPYSVTKGETVINDTVGDEPIAIFHVEGARSALDAAEISNSRADGSTGAYSRVINGQTLEFDYRSEEIRDLQTESVWDISGKAVSGEMEGEQLEPLIFGDYFAFAWLVFWPETELYEK